MRFWRGFFFLTAVLAAGCMHVIPVGSDIRPGVQYANKLKGNYALYIPPELANYEVLTRGTSSDPSQSWAAGLAKYTFKIGAPVTAAVTNALRVVTDSVQICSERPTRAMMDSLHLWGYFVPTVGDRYLESQMDAQTQQFNSFAAITMELEYYDRTDSLRFSCRSTHYSDAVREMWLESEAKAWGHAVENVLREISRDFAEAVSSSPEIRAQWLAPDSTQVPPE